MRKTQIICWLFALSFLTTESKAQVGIGTNSPEASSILDITSNNKGLLIPRVNSDSDVQNPAEGLIIYDKSDNCMNVYNNSTWINLCAASSGGGGSTGGSGGNSFASAGAAPFLKGGVERPINYGKTVKVSDNGSTLIATTANMENLTPIYHQGVYIYSNSNSKWDLDTVILGENAGSPGNAQIINGCAVSGNGNVIVVPVQFMNGNPYYTAEGNKEHARMYVYEKDGSNWVLRDDFKFIGDPSHAHSSSTSYVKTGNDHNSIKINSDGSKIFIGAPRNRTNSVNNSGNATLW
jgi:hypothetical protein